MRRAARLVALGCSLLGLQACTGMAGLGGSASYACQAPEGVTCNSVSGVYANTVGSRRPPQTRGPTPQSAASAASAPATTARTQPIQPLATPVGLRSGPRVLRLWFKAWVDADNDLFDQGYIYVQVDAGTWRLDHVQRQVRDRFAPIRPPHRGETPASTGGTRGPSNPTIAPFQVPPQPHRPAAPPAGSPWGTQDGS